MSGPRQVSRIAHKARRLLAREDYGQSGRSRRKRREPFGPIRTVCGKFGYTNRLAAEGAVDRMIDKGDMSGTLNVYECRTCDYFHVGHLRPTSTIPVSLSDGSDTTRPSGKWPSTTGSTDDC